MSGTLASLIRQHQLNTKTLYAAPETARESAPGEYDRTGSQKSPYLERLVEQKAARDAGEEAGFDPDELDDVGGFDELEDLINDRDTDPDGPDGPGGEPGDPLDPELPDPEDPETPDPEVEPPTPSPGVRAYALHSHAVSSPPRTARSMCRHGLSPLASGTRQASERGSDAHGKPRRRVEFTNRFRRPRLAL